METTVETTDPHTVRLTIEVPEDEFGKDLDRTYRAIANQIKIPGFRKGKVPKQIIDTQIGQDAIFEEFVNSSVPAYFRQAVADEHELEAHRLGQRDRREGADHRVRASATSSSTTGPMWSTIA